MLLTLKVLLFTTDFGNISVMFGFGGPVIPQKTLINWMVPYAILIPTEQQSPFRERHH